jgi:hypothetical protein
MEASDGAAEVEGASVMKTVWVNITTFEDDVPLCQVFDTKEKALAKAESDFREYLCDDDGNPFSGTVEELMSHIKSDPDGLQILTEERTIS